MNVDVILIWVGILVLYASASIWAWFVTDRNVVFGVAMVCAWLIVAQTIITGVIMGRKKR